MGKIDVEDIMYVVIFISIASLSTLYFLGEQASIRGVTDLPLSYNSSFDQARNLTATTEEIREAITNAPLSLSTAVSLYNAGYTLMRLMFNAIFLPVDITSAILIELAAPDWIYILLRCLWVIVIAGAIRQTIFGRPPA